MSDEVLFPIDRSGFSMDDGPCRLVEYTQGYPRARALVAENDLFSRRGPQHQRGAREVTPAVS